MENDDTPHIVPETSQDTPHIVPETAKNIPHGEKVSAAKLAVTAPMKADALARYEETTKLVHTGNPRVSREQWDEIIERMRCGDLVTNVAKMYGLSSGAIQVKCREDKDFRERFYDAIEDAMMQKVLEIDDIASGGELSTGDVARDRLIAEYRMKIGAKLNRKLADRATVQAETIQVIVNPDWGAGDF